MMNLLAKLFVIACVLVVAIESTRFAFSTDAEIRQGPVPIKASEYGVGRMIPDLTFSSLDGESHRLSDYRNHKAVVIAMTGTGCPLCLKYTPTLAAIEQEYRDRGIQFVCVNPNGSEKLGRLREAVAQHGIEGPYVKDGKKIIPQTLAANTTTEVFVIDPARTLVYRGAVDDQYGFGYALEAPRHNYLKEALEAVLVGRSPRVPATSSPGCELFYDETSGSAEPVAVTYHHQVSRIIQNHCVECHRDDGIAPIPLETYDQVRDYAGMIQSVVERGVMPPWFAAPQSHTADADAPQSQHWANERSLSSAEKADLFAWVAADAPEGDPADAPLTKRFEDGWLIGQPDAVFEFPEPIAVKATGTMPYKNVTVETDLDEGKWVRAIEVQPGDRRVVHHVIVSLQSDDDDEGSGYWGIYVPGNSMLDYPEGYAKWLPAGAKLRFQMHYTPNGTATEDSTRIGMIFAEESPRHEVKVTGIVDPKFKIPAGANNHPVSATLKVPQDVHILGFLPHMHLRGKAARYELVRGDQTETLLTETLLDVPRYDFNWQLLYRLADPRLMGSGDMIRYTSWYDNSAENPANPDPTRDVEWGQQTFDEMHLGYVEYVVDGETPERDDASGRGRAAKGDRLFQKLDVNADGFISRAEVRERMPDDKAASTTVFDRLDRDKNDKHELSRL